MANVRLTIGQGGVRFGRVFRDEQDMHKFDDKFRAGPFNYNDAAESDSVVTLRPHDPDERRCG